MLPHPIAPSLSRTVAASSSFSQRATATVATALPNTLMAARNMLMAELGPHDVEIAVSSPNNRDRHFCYEADTR